MDKGCSLSKTPSFGDEPTEPTEIIKYRVCFNEWNHWIRKFIEGVDEICVPKVGVK